jgi:low affinity Fe/Cu permease
VAVDDAAAASTPDAGAPGPSATLTPSTPTSPRDTTASGGHQVIGHEHDPRRRRRWVDTRRNDLVDEVQAHRWRRGLFRGSTPHDGEWSSRHWASRLLHRVGEIVANAATGVVAAGLIVAWVVVGVVVEFPAWWETILYASTASVTFVMVFVIQHTQSRQTTALQRKLDELIRVTAGTDSNLIAVEEAADEELQALADLNLGDRKRTPPA